MTLNDDDKDDGFVTIDLDEKPGAAPKLADVSFELEDDKDEDKPAPEPKKAQAGFDDEPDDEPEGDEGGKKRLTRNARLKIQRDRAIAEAQARADKIAELETKLAEREAAITTQTKEHVDYSLSQVDSALRSAKARLVEAINNGNAAEVGELQEHIGNLTFDKRMLEMNKARQPGPTQGGTPQPTTPQSEQRQPQQNRLHPKLQAWAQDNDAWLSNRPMKAAAITIEADLLQNEGLTHADDEFYVEMDKRLDKLFPTRNGETRKRSPVASPSRSTTSAPTGKVRLSAAEVATAKRLGVDLREYAKRRGQVDNNTDGGYTTIL